MKYSMYDDLGNITVLTKNSIKCLQCNTVLESKHRHDFQSCNCPNQAATDGGLLYQRILANDFDLIENLSEYTTYDKVEYEAKQKELKISRYTRSRVVN